MERRLWVLLRCPWCKKPLLVDDLSREADPRDQKHLHLISCDHFEWEPFSLDSDLPLYAIIAVRQYGHMWVLRPRHRPEMPYIDVQRFTSEIYDKLLPTDERVTP